jgi:nitroreductase
MDALECLIGRSSASALAAPAPSGAQLDAMLDAAVRAPDHGRLRPWRFVVIPEDRRTQFGTVLADCMKRRLPAATPEMLQREAAKAMRAPLIVVVAAHVERETKIPAIEQIAATAAAAENIMLAAHAQGFGAVWKTGAPAYDPGVRVALGLDAGDEIIGFLYVGTRTGEPATLPRPAASTFTSVWAG